MALERVPGPYRMSRSGVVDRVFSLRAGMFWADHRLGGRANARETLLDAFESALYAYLVREARGYQFVQAGCVGWRGRAIVVPGVSRAGEFSLVRALVDRGATYYSDDFAVFDRRGCVHAFPARLGLRAAEGAGSARPDWSSRVARTPLPLGLVVRTSFDAAGEWRPRRLTPDETVLALTPHAARANIAPAAVMSVLARSASDAIGIETRWQDAADAAARILELTPQV